MSLITLEVTLKDGRTLTGTYSIYEALARLKVAAAGSDFEDFAFKQPSNA